MPQAGVAAVVALVVAAGLFLVPSTSPAGVVSQSAALSGAVTAPLDFQQAALASGRVVGLSADSCGQGLVMSALSDDRGATWRAGQCVPDGFGVMPDSGGTSVSYYSIAGGPGLQQLDANGANSAVWHTSPLAVVVSSGIDGATAYVWDWNVSGLFAVSAAGAQPCGATPGITGFAASKIAAFGPLVLVVGHAFSQAWQVAVSSDSCASFTMVSRPAADDCVEVTVQPDGGVLCSQQTGSLRLDPRNLGAGWAPIALPSVDAQYGFGLARGGLEFHWLDAASRSWDPWTWPAPVRTLGATPGGAAAPDGALGAALAYLNTNYRRPMGIADAAWQPQIALAAQRHADYWVANGTGVGLAAHDETPGNPGFEGSNPYARCQAAGVPAAYGCGGEVAYLGVSSPEQAMAGWLGTPFHGSSMLSAVHIGIGTSSAGAVADFDYRGTPANVWAGVSVFDYDAVPNTAAATEHAWPFDGATGIPARWSGGEVPDPLAGYTGDRSNVGPPLFYSTLNPVRVTLLTAAGAVVPLITPQPGGEIVDHGTVTSVTSAGAFLTWAAFPAQALTAGARYTLVLSPELPGLPERHFTFTVAAAPVKPVATAPAKPRAPWIVLTRVRGCRERIVRTPRASGYVAFRFVASGCRSQALQRYRKGAWRPVHGRTIVVAHGVRARWRVKYKRRVIASGHVTG